MGCDGGTIPKRDELVKVKKRPEAKDKTAELGFQWRCCAITQEALEEPIVTCGLGKIYNKCSIIEVLLNRSQIPENLKHIKTMKDVRELNPTPNPEYNSRARKTEGMLDIRASPYVCPIIGLEMSGRFRFVCLWTCGCVMSERAIKEINMKTCQKCQMPFTKKDIVVLNGNEEDLKTMTINMEERQALIKAQKKLKNKKIKQETTSQNDIIPPIEETSVSLQGTSSFSQMLTNVSVKTSTQLIKHKRCESNTLMDPEIKKIKIDYSVAKDPKVTDVYKSLFTTHQSEKKQTRAHWITYNPFYN